MANEELKVLAKECLSIVPTATAKDGEISLWVNMALADMKRQGIDTVNNLNDDLVKGAVMMYVRGNFGNTDIKEKELCQKSYNQHVAELSLSEGYKEVESDV